MSNFFGPFFCKETEDLSFFSPGTPSSKAHPFFQYAYVLVKFFFSKIRLAYLELGVQTVAVFVLGYGCAQRSARERIRMVLFYGE